VDKLVVLKKEVPVVNTDHDLDDWTGVHRYVAAPQGGKGHGGYVFHGHIDSRYDETGNLWRTPRE
jgi:hypothetical protein